MFTVKVLIEAYVDVPDVTMARRDDLLKRVGNEIGAGTLRIAQVHFRIVPPTVVPPVKRPTF